MRRRPLKIKQKLLTCTTRRSRLYDRRDYDGTMLSLPILRTARRARWRVGRLHSAPLSLSFTNMLYSTLRAAGSIQL
jgi:hypothetical protein